jgi:hypothetical protein
LKSFTHLNRCYVSKASDKVFDLVIQFAELEGDALSLEEYATLVDQLAAEFAARAEAAREACEFTVTTNG